MASDAWVLSHLLAALGFLLLVFGVLAIYSYLSGTDAERLAFAAMIVTLVGAIMLFAIGSIEGVALNALGRLHIAGKVDVLDGVTAVRMGPGVVLFVGGLLAFAVGGVLFAVAIWRSALLPRWAGVALALAMVLFPPLLPRPVRIADGILIGVGAIGLAWRLWVRRAAS